jgi:molybdate transport system substrate-binding protein
MKPLFSILLLVFFLGACGSKPTTAPLRVAAASDLDPALRDIATKFEKERGIPVTLNFGSTGTIAKQIEQGAPVDVFFAANASFVENLEKKELVLGGSTAVYGFGRLVVWQRDDAKFHISTLNDLADARVARLGIANPEHAPYGQAAREALQKANMWNAVEKKLVFGENVGDTLQFARTGNADAAIVGRSQVRTLGGRTVEIDRNLYTPLAQTLCIPKRTTRATDAKAFADYVLSETGKRILRDYGIDPR